MAKSVRELAMGQLPCSPRESLVVTDRPLLAVCSQHIATDERRLTDEILNRCLLVDDAFLQRNFEV